MKKNVGNGGLRQNSFYHALVFRYYGYLNNSNFWIMDFNIDHYRIFSPNIYDHNYRLESETFGDFHI